MKNALLLMLILVLFTTMVKYSRFHENSSFRLHFINTSSSLFNIIECDNIYILKNNVSYLQMTYLHTIEKTLTIKKSHQNCLIIFVQIQKCKKSF